VGDKLPVLLLPAPFVFINNCVAVVHRCFDRSWGQQITQVTGFVLSVMKTTPLAVGAVGAG
jgi:hypothetical protein